MKKLERLDGEDTIREIMSGVFYERNSLLEFVKNFYPYENTRNKYRVLKRYLDGERVPSFQNAKILLKDMGFNYTEDELIEILNNSVQEKEGKIKKKSIVSNLIINYGEILTNYDYSEEEKEVMLKGCLAMLNCKTVKEYIIELINEDITNTVIDIKKEKD